jgi:integrase/recombinase XerD
MTPPFSAFLQRFFTERLTQQRQASPHTIAAYRDTFRLLLQFAEARLHRPPSALAMDDLSPAFIGEFLEHLGRDRHNSSRTCNARLAAIHAFAQFVALQEPAHALIAPPSAVTPSVLR